MKQYSVPITEYEYFVNLFLKVLSTYSLSGIGYMYSNCVCKLNDLALGLIHEDSGTRTLRAEQLHYCTEHCALLPRI